MTTNMVRQHAQCSAAMSVMLLLNIMKFHLIHVTPKDNGMTHNTNEHCVGVQTYTLSCPGSGVAKVGHTGAHALPTQSCASPKMFLAKFENDSRKQLTIFLVISNIPKPSMILYQSVQSLNGSLLDHKFRQCILIVWNIPSNCGITFVDNRLVRIQLATLATIYLCIQVSIYLSY